MQKYFPFIYLLCFQFGISHYIQADDQWFGFAFLMGYFQEQGLANIFYKKSQLKGLEIFL